MAKKVRYAASEGQGAVTVEGRRFRPGEEQSVPDALAKKLLSGKEESLKGFTFEAVEQEQKPKETESTTGSDT